MKQKFFTVFLIAGIIIFTAISAFADNPTYRVYNPRQNKTYTASMGTIGLGNNEYVFGFFDNKTHEPLCAFTLHYTNINPEGFCGGYCYDQDNRKLSYREIIHNTFDNEIQAIIKERKQEGYRYRYEQ